MTLFEKLTTAQVVKKFSNFHGTQKPTTLLPILSQINSVHITLVSLDQFHKWSLPFRCS